MCRNEKWHLQISFKEKRRSRMCCQGKGYLEFTRFHTLGQYNSSQESEVFCSKSTIYFLIYCCYYFKLQPSSYRGAGHFEKHCSAFGSLQTGNLLQCGQMGLKKWEISKGGKQQRNKIMNKLKERTMPPEKREEEEEVQERSVLMATLF